MKTSVPKKIVLIGASTGGPGQIQKIITALPNLEDTTVIIAQHMVQGFIESFASRLQDISHNPVSLIQDKETLSNNCIYLCECTTKLNTSSINLTFTKENCSVHAFNPDINALFNSFEPMCSRMDILSVILTGIGDDGVSACSNLNKSGARCVTESQESAIVDGMPNRARAFVPNIEVYDMEQIVKIISEFCDV